MTTAAVTIYTNPTSKLAAQFFEDKALMLLNVLSAYKVGSERLLFGLAEQFSLHKCYYKEKLLKNKQIAMADDKVRNFEDLD